MKATELRKGNLVYDETNRKCELLWFNHKEIQLKAEFSLIKLTKNKGCSTDNFYNLVIKPISLTEEWLLKFGFKIEEHKNGNSFNIRISFIGLATEFLTLINKGSIKEPIWFISITRSFDSVWMPLPTRIDYVHQIQNLYFALTNKELEWKN